MSIQLSDHFTYPRLIRFLLPSIAMMIVTSVYSVVDGLFVSNLVGDAALAAVNIVFPLPMVLGAFGFMLGTGGSAEVARVMGAGEPERAKEYFTTLILTILLGGAVLSLLCVLFIRPLSYLLGADDALLADCVSYGSVITAGTVLFMLQTSFQSFCVVAERPKMGLWLSIASGVTNMVLDYLFIAVLRWGVIGAAWGTVAGYAVGGLIPLGYFLLPNSSTLRLVRTRLYPRMLLKSCLNGSSELLTNISASLITILYNRSLMDMAGSRGVAAYTVMMYVQFIFAAVFIGIAIGAAPIVSFHYGAGDPEELKSLLRKCMVLLCALSLVMFLTAEGLTLPLSRLFVSYDRELLSLTAAGMRIFSLSYLIFGFNIFSSSFFTALGDGPVSALISFSRTLLFQAGAILLLPRLLGLSGIWWATPAAEALALAVSVLALAACRKKYRYA